MRDSPDLDTFSPPTRAFYERVKAKLALSVCFSVCALALIGFTSSDSGRSNYYDILKSHQVNDDMEDAYNALSSGYGFSGFCNFVGFCLLLIAAVYYSPLLFGSHRESDIIIHPRDISIANEEAEDVEGYAASAMDNIFGYVNDTFGEKLSAIFINEDAEEDTDALLLLATLALSKLGITLAVDINWSAFETAFGWTSNISLVIADVPDVSPFVVKTVVFSGLLLLQPACYARMWWLSKEHQKLIVDHFSSMFVRVELKPYDACFTPLICILLALFFIIFIPSYSVGKHMASGFAFILFGLPGAYLLVVNLARKSVWQYVDLRYADVVKRRQYEDLSLREGSYLLFIFVASYSFIMNFFIEYMATWDTLSGAQRAFLVIGFMVYSTIPLGFIAHVITAVNADRTFRMFRAQLVTPFNDKNLYMKIVLLIESLFFSLCMIAFSPGPLGQLTGGFIIAVIFLVYTMYARPFDDPMEDISDIISRGSACFTVMLGLIAASSSSVSSDAMSVFLIINSLLCWAWFLYALDLKDMVLNRFFLLLQMYAQSKAVHYTKDTIPLLSESRIKKLTSSPIEFHVLSAVQRIYFATLRKDVFFSGSRIKELSDIGVTWLDLYQTGFDVTSLLALGFTVEELMAVDAQLDDMGDRSDIQGLYEKAYADKIAACGKNHGESLKLLYTLGMFYKDIGEHNRAMEHLTDCLESQNKEIGEFEDDTLRTKQSIGEYYTFLRRPGDGVPLLQAVYEARKKISVDAPETLDSMRALAKALSADGRVVEARELLEERLRITVQTAIGEKLRVDHPNTLQSRLDLALCLVECGKYRAVEELNLHTVMNRQKTMHGSHNKNTLDLMSQYATLLSKMGHHKEASRLQAEIVYERECTLGPEHTTTFTSCFALAETYIELGMTKELTALDIESRLVRQEQTLGETHPTTLSSTLKVAGLYYTMSKYDDALSLFRKCHAVRKDKLGERHELVLNVSNNIAATLDSMGLTDESKTIYEETLEILRSTVGEHHVTTAGVMLNLGQQRQRTGDFKDAKRLYEYVYQVGMESFGETHPRTLLAQDFLGCLELVQENFQKACDILESCYALRIKVYDECYPACLSCMENIASCKRQLGKMDEASNLFTRVCQLYLENYGERHLDTIRAHAGYAILLADMGRAGAGLPIMKKCIWDMQAIAGKKHYLVYEYMGSAGYILAHMRRNEEGLVYTNQALDGMRELYGDDHFQTKTLYARKAYLLQQLGRHVEAQQASALSGSQAQPTTAPDVESGHASSSNPMHTTSVTGGGELAQAAEMMRGLGQVLSAIQHPHTTSAGSMSNAVQDPVDIAKQCWAQGQYQQAISMMDRAFELRSSQYGEVSEPAIAVLADKAMYLYSLGMLNESHSEHVRVIQLMVLLQGSDHEGTMQTLKAIQELYTAKGMVFDDPTIQTVDGMVVAVEEEDESAEKEDEESETTKNEE